MMSDARHSRQRLFAPIGNSGQERIENARVLVVGCGALGSHAVEVLARAGVGRGSRGFLRIVDRDYVDVSNLQRQALFDLDDARTSRPKAVAAAARVAAIDPDVEVQSHVRDFSAGNAVRFVEDIDIIIDGTDNFRTRFIINDAAIAHGRPWVYGGAVGSRGVAAFFHPPATPCFRCLMEAAPPLGTGTSCETAGIIAPLPRIVSSIQVAMALRFVVEDAWDRGLLTFDAWAPLSSHRTLFAEVGADPACVSCGSPEKLPALADGSEEIVTLCGRNSVQIRDAVRVALDAAASRFESLSRPWHRHPQSVTAEIAEGRLTLFDDGRVIVEGTTDPLEARSIVDRYLAG